MIEKQSTTAVAVSLTGFSGSDSQSNNVKASSTTGLLSFWRREFGRTEPTRLWDLVAFPLAVSATAGLIAGVWGAAKLHFLDPAFIGYSIGVNVAVQIVILALSLALAFITRRKAWSGTLFAIAYFCFLAVPQLVKLVLPGVVHPLIPVIGLLAAFQITRSVNRRRHSRFALWMIAVPALLALCALSFGRMREYSLMSGLPNPPQSPNVLIIIVDTLRADHLSPYGYSRDTSPYLTQLAQQGVLFENAIAPSSWTLPSHASMLTGLYPHESRVQAGKDILSGSLPNLGETMRRRGYRTAAFSANYELFTRDHGFIHCFSHYEEYEQSIGGILEKVPLSKLILEALSHVTIGEKFAYFGEKNAPTTERVDKNALDWIEKGHRPFFVVLNYFDLHEPTLPPEHYLHMFTTNPKARTQNVYFDEKCTAYAVKPLCAPEMPQIVDVYDGSIRYVDGSIQHLLSELTGRGVLQNTIVVFTSDHGQEFGDHGIYGHGKSLYRQVIQVPLIIWKPGLVPASVRVPTPVSTTDIAATILDLTAPDGKQALPGRSLAPLWHSSEAATGWPDPMSQLAQLHWFVEDAPNYNGPVDSLVTPDWHYLRQEGQNLLFDWKNDPDETHDLCAAQPAACSTMKSQLQTDEATSRQAH
jgi:arylsulfatase A-like enzyme